MAGSQGQASQFCFVWAVRLSGCRIPSDMALGGGPVPPQGKHKAPTPFVFLNGSCESRRTLGDRCWCRTQILPLEPCVPSGAVLCGLPL